MELFSGIDKAAEGITLVKDSSELKDYNQNCTHFIKQ
jgi:hypothetical protein